MSHADEIRDPDRALHVAAWDQGLAWRDWLDSGEIAETMAWRQEFGAVALDDDARRTLAGFTEPLRLLSVSGLWCSDSMRTGALLARIADAAAAIELRFVDRERVPDLMERHRVLGARRIPVTLVLARDFARVDAIGDRPLARYRSVAAQRLGDAAPATLAPAPSGEAVTRDSARELIERLERAHLLVRLAPRRG